MSKPYYPIPALAGETQEGYFLAGNTSEGYTTLSGETQEGYFLSGESPEGYTVGALNTDFSSWSAGTKLSVLGFAALGAYLLFGSAFTK